MTVDQEGRIVMKERDAWHWKNEFRVETKEAGERREEVEKAESKEKTAEKAEKTKEKKKNWLERFGVLLGGVLIVGILARLIYRKILG